MKARKKKQIQREKSRVVKEIVKTIPSFHERDEDTYFNYEMDVKEAEEALKWASTI